MCDKDDWHDAAIEVDYLWTMFMDTPTPLGQAKMLVQLQDAMSDLRTFLPGFDYESGTLPWERETDGF